MEVRGSMRLAYFLYVLGIALAVWGVVNLIQPLRAPGIFFVLAAIAFGAGYMLQRRRSG